MIERRRSARWLVVLVAALAVVLGISHSALARTTSTDAGSFTYDVPTVARVDARASVDADSGSAQFTGMREGSASLSVEARGTSTTPTPRNIATKSVDDGWAATRAAELQGQLPAGSQGRVTMGAGVLEDASGNQIRVISTSEPNGYLRPGVTSPPGEIVISGTGHAEADIIAYAQANGYRVVTIGAGRPICASCASGIAGSGGSAATPLKGPR